MFVHRSVFVAAASPRSRQTGDFLSGKSLVLLQQRSLGLRESVLQEELELYQGITESYRLESLFYMHTSFNKHLLTCPVVKPQTAFPKKQRSSEFCRTPVQKCSRERWCHSLLCSLRGVHGKVWGKHQVRHVRWSGNSPVCWSRGWEERAELC